MYLKNKIWEGFVGCNCGLYPQPNTKGFKLRQNSPGQNLSVSVMVENMSWYAQNAFPAS